MRRRNFLYGVSAAVALVLAKVGIVGAAECTPSDSSERSAKPIKLYSPYARDVNVLCVEKLVAGLREQYEIKDIDYVLVKDPETIVVHVAFADPAEMWVAQGRLSLDDEEYTLVKCMDLSPQGGGWCSLLRRADPHPDLYVCDLSDETPTDIYNQGQLIPWPT